MKASQVVCDRQAQTDGGMVGPQGLRRYGRCEASPMVEAGGSSARAAPAHAGMHALVSGRACR
jgi:hypothetical protein